MKIFGTDNFSIYHLVGKAKARVRCEWLPIVELCITNDFRLSTSLRTYIIFNLRYPHVPTVLNQLTFNLELLFNIFFFLP